jgi:AraC-like DNA-binding protein
VRLAALCGGCARLIICSRATVERALRLIVEDGALDAKGATVERLAVRLGVGARQLTRLFARHLQASPPKVARTARAQRAKRLIDETSLVVVGISVGERQTPHTIGMRRCEDLRYTAAAIVADQVDLIDLERGEGLAQHIGVGGDGHVLIRIDLGVAM